jgi:hypothetical protein
MSDESAGNRGVAHSLRLRFLWSMEDKEIATVKPATVKDDCSELSFSAKPGDPGPVRRYHCYRRRSDYGRL